MSTYQDRHDAIDAVQNMQLLTPRQVRKQFSGDVCGWCHQPIKIQIFMGSGHCCEDHRKLLAGETGVANPNPRGRHASRSE